MCVHGDVAIGTKMGHRIGTTHMSYISGHGSVSGRAWRGSIVGPFTVTNEIDTSFGPVNFAVQTNEVTGQQDGRLLHVAKSVSAGGKR
eukprot:SAG31_NODE_19057_length_613_cov_0.994163_1_plen_88_part_00